MNTNETYHGTCSYSPEDDKLRLYPFARLDQETYARVKAAGYNWAPKQECFYAVWGPGREDIALELAGEIDDEDTSLVERAEARADRFGDYSDKREAEANAQSNRAHALAYQINGQPILVGHHSEKRARADQRRIQAWTSSAVHLWKTAQYWQDRAQGALRHAKYKGRPDVRARRIKGLEADLRKQEKNKAEAEQYIRLWETVGSSGDPAKALNTAKYIANFDHIHLPDGHAWGWSIWAALDKGTCTPAEARDYSIASHQASLPHCQRWIDHLTLRIEYERAMLAGDGGTVADQTKPEKGGAVRCWVCRHTSEWLTIAKVNKVSVTVLDNWGNGGSNFTRTVPFTDLKGVMTVADVEAKRESGLLRDNAHGTGFYVLDVPPTAPTT